MAKRKSFSFEEADYKRLNALIGEYVEDNEGKSQSDFILDLMGNYEAKKNSIGNKLKAQSEDIQVRIGGVSEKVTTGMHRIVDQSSGKVSEFTENIKKMDASNKIKDNLSQTSGALKSGLSKLTDKSKEGIGKLQEKIKKSVSSEAEEA